MSLQQQVKEHEGRENKLKQKSKREAADIMRKVTNNLHCYFIAAIAHSLLLSMQLAVTCTWSFIIAVECIDS